MGKSLDDLPLDDSPLDDGAWSDFCAEIDRLIMSDDYAWALDTLEGIRETVSRYQHVTEGQRRAIANIRDARKGGEKKWGRRYEGWRR
jgi:hypothetical protein